jgi:cyclophilin family peptidyl-prolyl cis-trans isomerase
VRLALAGVLAGAVGCGRQPAEPQAQQPAPAAQPSPKKEPVPIDPRWQRPFAEATRADPPADWPPPPDVTITGKSVGKLYTDVVKAWDGVRFLSDDGKRVVHTAVLETDQGAITIELRPDWAPNHVRSFVALARAGYYDGLVFDRVIHQESDVRPGDKLDLIEAGCPLGTGETGTGSIGYWLKPEFNAELQHEEGCVGACRGEEADTAATRFYITLGKAPFLNGNYTLFGKVTQGLDVARKIFQQPLREDEQDTDGDHRPLNPVVIRKVTVRTKEVDKSGPGGEN